MQGPFVNLTIRFAALTAALFWMSTASAATCQFSPVSGAWNVPANWSGCGTGNGVPAGTPGPADIAQVSGGRTASLPPGAVNVDQLFLSDGTVTGTGIGASTLTTGASTLTNWTGTLNTLNGLTFQLGAGAGINTGSSQLSITGAEWVTNGGTSTMGIVNVSGTGARIILQGGTAYRASGDHTLVSGAVFTNQSGVFTAISSLTFDGPFDNGGNLEIPAGVTLTVTQPALYAHTSPVFSLIFGAGTFSAPGQTLTLAMGGVRGNIGPGLTFNVGTLHSSGAILRPAPNFMSVGLLAINGNLSMTGSASADFNLAGIAPSQYDRIVVSGTANLGGTFSRQALGTFAPPVGTFLDIITAGSVVGTFFGGSEGIVFDAPRRYLEQYTATQVRLRANETVWVVGDPADTGMTAPTLRNALTRFNAESASGCINGPYSIHFGLPMGMNTIQPATPLPTISGCVDLTIAGYTQPGSSVNSSNTDWNAVLNVNLDGTSCPGCDGLVINAGSINVRGINFANWTSGLRINASGNAAQASGNYFFQNAFGLYHDGANNINVGGPAPADRNVFVHSTTAGIASLNAGGAGSFFVNNLVGAGAGLTPGPNVKGIHLLNTNDATINNNIVVFNDKGIAVGTGVRNAIYANKISGNTTIGIDLDDDGPTPNDDATPPYDTDNGGNQLLNFPVISSITQTGMSTGNVSFTLKSTPSSDFNVCICVNATGGNQCQQEIGCTPYSTNASGLVSGAIAATGMTPGVSTVTAFTRAVAGPKAGNSSELSPAVTFAAAAPAVSITGSGAFPNTTVAASSAVQAITITNTGGGTLTINSITNSGAPVFVDTTSGPAPNAAHYCGFGSNAMGQPQTAMPINIPAMGSCTLNLIFAPGVFGPATGVITVNSNAPGSPHTIMLTGSGIAPTTSFTPTSLAHGNITVGASGVLTGTFANTSPATITLGSPFASPAAASLAITGGMVAPCTNGMMLPTMTGCTFTSTFTPGGVGMLSSSYTFDFTAGGQPFSSTVAVTGSGVAAGAPVFNPSATTFNFPSQVITTTSAAQTLTITNAGGSNLTVSAPMVVGPFAIGTNSCTTVVPMSSCAISFTFTPASAGAVSGGLVLATNATGSPHMIVLNGQGALPGTTYAPAAGLNFGSLAVGSTSTSQQITFTNASPLVLAPASISFTGGGAGFNVLPSSQCLMTPMLAPMAACTFDITATPNATGALADSVYVNTNPANTATPAVVPLTVTGLAPPTPTLTVGFSPGSVNTGVNSTLTFTLGNPTASGAVIVAGSFVPVTGLTLSALTDSCGLGAFISTGSVDFGMGGTLPAMGSCTVTVQAQSAMPGTFTVNVPIGSLITSSGNNINISSAALTVTAAPTGPFAYIPIFTSFSGNTVSVIDLPTNTLATTITVGAGPVGAAVNPAGTRAYISNQQSNSISVIDTATNTVVATVPVGSQPGSAAVNPAGTRVYVPNQSSNSMSVIDTATNTVVATIPGLTFPSAAAVNPSGSKVFVTLSTPNAIGVVDTGTNTLIGTIPVCTGPYQPVVNSAGTRVYVACTSGSVAVIDAGTGTVIATIPVGANPRGIALTPNGAQAWTSNSGSNNVSVIDTATNTVTNTLPAGTTPWGVAGNAAGTRMYVANSGSNNVSVFDTSTNTVIATVPVGVGPVAIGQFLQPGAVAANPVLSRSPAAAAFGGRTVNSTSPATVVTIGNSGTANLIITGITISGDFGFTTTCPISTPPLAPLATCTVSITFTPLTVAALAGTLTITSNAPGSPHTIALTGTGLAVAAPAIAVNTSVLNLGGTVVNTTGAQQAVIVTNTGFANLNISGITVSGAGFARVTPSTGSPINCGTSVAPSGTCQIAVACTPAVVGTLTGTMSIAHNAIGSPTLVNLICTGNALPVATVALSAALDFGDQVINTSSAARAVSIANTGTAPLTVSSIALTGTDSNQFAQTGVCTSVAAGASCDVLVNFAPTSIGAKSAGLIVTSNAQNAQTTNRVALSGNGVLAPRPVAVPSVTAIGFGNTIFGGASPMQLISFKNEGGLAMTISGLVATGDFTQMNNCGGSVASFASCNINVAFNPLAIGSRSGELLIMTNAQGSPHRIFLSGTGCRWFSQPGSRLFLTAC